MTDDRELEGLDPYELFDAEAARLETFMRTLHGAQWDAPSRCDGWTVRDLLGHLAASEQYHAACLDGRVPDFLKEMGERGAIDLETANAIGIADFAGLAASEVISAWTAADADTRRRLRAADGTDIDSSVGPYPARWQAFHVASELATHADDIGLPVDPAEASARTAWRARFSRFAVHEVHPEVEFEVSEGRTIVRAGGAQVEIDDDTLVEAAAARLPAGHALDPEIREALNTMP